jgi:hypothetical protein
MNVVILPMLAGGLPFIEKQLASAQWCLFRLWQLENKEMEAFC